MDGGGRKKNRQANFEKSLVIFHSSMCLAIVVLKLMV
jgi:hypothetical protein